MAVERNHKYIFFFLKKVQKMTHTYFNSDWNFYIYFISIKKIDRTFVPSLELEDVRKHC